MGTESTFEPYSSTVPVRRTVLVTAAKLELLPAPLGPMMPRISPSDTVQDTSLSARRLP